MFPNSNMLNQSAVDALYSATYLEDYLDSVESLPDDLQRHVTRLKEIDLVIQSYFREISGSMKRLLQLMKKVNGNPGEISRLQSRIQALLISCQELGDEKIHVGQAIHEAIESKTRQLELDRKNLESVYRATPSAADVKESTGQVQQKDERKRVRRIRQETFIPSILGPATLTPTLYNADGKCTQPTVVDPTPPVTAKQTSSTSPFHKNFQIDEQKHTQIQSIPATNSASQTGSGLAKDKTKDSASLASSSSSTPKKSEKRALEANQTQMKRPRRRRRSSTKAPENPVPLLPMDPDEPTYCLCDQVSYGEMIGCDNDLCPIEWFHFSCVSLSTKPKGKWFCPKCRGDRPNQMKPKNIFLKELESYNKEKEEKN